MKSIREQHAMPGLNSVVAPSSGNEALRRDGQVKTACLCSLAIRHPENPDEDRHGALCGRSTRTSGCAEMYAGEAGYEVLCAATGTQAPIVFARQDLQGVLLEYDLPDVTGGALRAEMKRIKPEVPILRFSGVGSQTRFPIRFFDSYQRNDKTPEWSLQELDS